MTTGRRARSRDGAIHDLGRAATALLAGLVLAACGGGASPVDGVAGKVCSGERGSGWCWQRPLPQGNSIAAYAFPDDAHGWAVGEAGTLLASTDGGATWSSQHPVTGLDLVHVVFTDAKTGWVVSSAAQQANTVLRTRDGGATWESFVPGAMLYVQTLGASGPDTAWLLGGNSQAAYMTRDGGAHWTPVTAPDFSGTLTVDPGSGDVWRWSSYDDPLTPLLRSADLGATWAAVSPPAPAAGWNRSLTDLQWTDSRHALVAAVESSDDAGTQLWRAGMWTTVDGGASWQDMSPSPGSRVLATARYLLVEAATVYAAAPSDLAPSVIERTTDRGMTWQSVPLPSGRAGHLNGFTAFSSSRLLLTEDSGKSWLSTDAGGTWHASTAQGPPGSRVTSLWFFDRREGIAVATDGTRVRTLDGGQTWNADWPGFAGPTGCLQFLADGSQGWAVDDAGRILRSSDQGRTWVLVGSLEGRGAAALHFIDAEHGWAIAPASNGGPVVFASSDGGDSWRGLAGTEAFTGGAVAIRFRDASHGIVAGPSGVAWVTFDGGRTWSSRPTGTSESLQAIDFLDDEVAVAVGTNGAIARTTDGGRNWTTVPSAPFRRLFDVRRISPSTVLAVGAGGLVLISDDGGASWALQPTGARADLHAVAFVDSRVGWIAGSNGTILATVTGGR